MERAMRILAVVVLCAGVAAGAGGAAVETPAGRVLRPADILGRAKAALGAAGNIKAELTLDVRYPSAYKSEIVMLASSTGDERSEMTTTINESTFRTTSIMSKGTLWTVEEAVGGTLVTKIDVDKVKKALREEGEDYAALPVLGPNVLTDLGHMAKIVKFDKSEAGVVGGRAVHVVSGGPWPGFEKGKRQLPLGAAKFYGKVKVYIDVEDYLPRKVELGEEEGKVLLSLEFKSLERNVAVPAGAFDYTPGEDAEVVDRTEWAIRQFKGE